MIQVFFGGALFGLILSVSLGPAFFSIVQTSIDKGFKNAFQIALGVILSDFILIIISYFGISAVLSAEKYHPYIAIAGGVVLILFGIHTFRKKPQILIQRYSKYKTLLTNPKPVAYIGKGFLMNFMNPFLWLLWFSTLSGLISQFGYYKNFKTYVFIFFLGTLLIIFSMDILKSYIGAKIKKYLRPRIQYRINRTVGVFLMIFGVLLIGSFFTDFSINSFK